MIPLSAVEKSNSLSLVFSTNVLSVCDLNSKFASEEKKNKDERGGGGRGGGRATTTTTTTTKSTRREGRQKEEERKKKRKNKNKKVRTKVARTDGRCGHKPRVPSKHVQHP